MNASTDTPGEHSQDFKKQVVDEAYEHTPSGGYPAVAEKYGIAPALVFEWVEAAHPSPPAPFSSVHVWLGSTGRTAEEFHTYFAHAESYWEIDWDTQDPGESDHDLTGCPFCIDLGRKYLYDDDLIYIAHHPAPLPVKQIVDDLPLRSEAAVAAILQACAERGISTANAVFSYADPTQVVAEPQRRYNGLTYLGLFRNDAEKNKKDRKTR